ncbi:MAG: copper amine oxidase N-terminal domain-containing protein [Desulfotomaculales bacterium]
MVLMDTAPVVVNDRTFVPVRFLANALGVRNQNILWDGYAKKVTLTEPGTPRVEMCVGRVQVLSDGIPVEGTDVAPFIQSPGRTMLPARFVARALGYEVEWLPDKYLVVCWKKDQPKPQPADVMGGLADELAWRYIGTGDNRVAVPPGSEKWPYFPRYDAYYKEGVVVGVSEKDAFVGWPAPYTPFYLPQMIATAKEVLTRTFGDQDFVNKLMDWQYQEKILSEEQGQVLLTAPDGRRVTFSPAPSVRGAIFIIAPAGQRS